MEEVFTRLLVYSFTRLPVQDVQTAAVEFIYTVQNVTTFTQRLPCALLTFALRQIGLPTRKVSTQPHVSNMACARQDWTQAYKETPLHMHCKYTH